MSIERKSTFTELHDLIIEKSPDLRFFAECILELNDPRILTLHERGTEGKKYRPLALGVVGYDRNRIRSHLFFGDVSDEFLKETHKRYLKRLRRLMRGLDFGGSIDRHEWDVLNLVKKAHKKLLVALLLVNVEGTDIETLQLKYPDLYEEYMPGRGPNVALIFVRRAARNLKLN